MLRDQLIALRDSMVAQEYGRRVAEPWWADSEVPTWDFNREIVPPGRHDIYRDGAIGIRTDDDFWAVAVLPPEFIDLPLPEIVKVLWPYVDEPEFNPDSEYQAPRQSLPIGPND